MSLVETTREIDGMTVEVTEFPATRKVRLQHRVMKVLAPLMGSGIGSIDLGDNTSILDAGISFNGDVLGRAIERAFDKLPEADFERLMLDMLHSTRVDGKLLDKSEMINLTFKGSNAVKNIYACMLFAWEVNYGPLPLDRFTSMIGRFMPSENEQSGNSTQDNEND